MPLSRPQDHSACAVNKCDCIANAAHCYTLWGSVIPDMKHKAATITTTSTPSYINTWQCHRTPPISSKPRFGMTALLLTHTATCRNACGTRNGSIRQTLCCAQGWSRAAQHSTLCAVQHITAQHDAAQHSSMPCCEDRQHGSRAYDTAPLSPQDRAQSHQPRTHNCQHTGVQHRTRRRHTCNAAVCSSCIVPGSSHMIWHWPVF